MGDLGGESAPLSHRRLEERAIREGWQVPQNIRTKVLKRLAAVIDPETVEGAQAELRYVIQAARTIISADLRQQAIDLMPQQADAAQTEVRIVDLVGKAEKRALERLQQRALDPPAQ